MRKISSFFSAALVLALFGFGQKAVAQGMTFPYTEGFEGSIPDTWTTIDADGDTWGWIYSGSGYYQQAHTGTGMAASFSWSGGQNLNPDNWLVSPDITGATKLRYFVSMNELYPNEHYAVMVKVAGQEDFTVLFSETLSNPRGQSAWFERTVDLPAGTKQIAFRHYNCTGQNYLRIDDAEFTNGSGPVNLNPVQNLSGTINADGRLVLSWEAPAAVAKATTRTVLLSEGFESVANEGTAPAGWLTVDADGDGNSWMGFRSPDVSILTPHGGNAVMGSLSWNKRVDFTPDNYLITPLVEGATQVKFYYAVNPGFPAEHYAVMASSTGTNVADFSVVYEETPTGRPDADKTRGDKDSMQSGWIERTVNLPAGTKYVAFRHFQSSGQHFIFLDDVTIYSAGGNDPEYTYTVYRDGAQVAENLTTTTYTEEGVTSTHEYCVEVKYAAGVSPKQCVTLTPGSVEGVFAAKPYTLTIVGNTITVNCQGEGMIYDMNGRRLTAGRDVVVYEAQTGHYAVMIVVDGKSYVEKVTVK